MMHNNSSCCMRYFSYAGLLSTMNFAPVHIGHPRSKCNYWKIQLMHGDMSMYAIFLNKNKLLERFFFWDDRLRMKIRVLLKEKKFQNVFWDLYCLRMSQVRQNLLKYLQNSEERPKFLRKKATFTTQIKELLLLILKHEIKPLRCWEYCFHHIFVASFNNCIYSVGGQYGLEQNSS